MRHSSLVPFGSLLWEWPVDMLSYDRTLWLSDEEQLLLRAGLSPAKGNRAVDFPQHLKQTLHRLLSDPLMFWT